MNNTRGTETHYSDILFNAGYCHGFLTEKEIISGKNERNLLPKVNYCDRGDDKQTNPEHNYKVQPYNISLGIIWWRGGGVIN